MRDIPLKGGILSLNKNQSSEIMRDNERYFIKNNSEYHSIFLWIVFKMRNPVKSSTLSGHAVQWRSEATLVKTLYINWTTWGQPPGFFVENLLLESVDRNCE